CVAAAISGGVDKTVVTEHAGREAKLLDGGPKKTLDRRGGGDREHGRAERGARMIVDEVDDLDVGAVCQVPVGHIALPALVGKIGGEADPTGARSLLGLGC